MAELEVPSVDPEAFGFTTCSQGSGLLSRRTTLPLTRPSFFLLKPAVSPRHAGCGTSAREGPIHQ